MQFSLSFDVTFEPNERVKLVDSLIDYQCHNERRASTVRAWSWLLQNHNNFRFCRCSTCCFSLSSSLFIVRALVTSFLWRERALARVWILQIFHLHFSLDSLEKKIRWTYRKSREHFADLFHETCCFINFLSRLVCSFLLLPPFPSQLAWSMKTIQ